LLLLSTPVGRPLGLRLLSLGVRRSLLRLLGAPVGWPLLLDLLSLSGRQLSVVLAALRTSEPGRGKEKNKSRYCVNTFHCCEPPPKTKPEAPIRVTSVSGRKGQLLFLFPEGIFVQQRHQFCSRFGRPDAAGHDLTIFESLPI
jgi:hypothetical protein